MLAHQPLSHICSPECSCVMLSWGLIQNDPFEYTSQRALSKCPINVAYYHTRSHCGHLGDFFFLGGPGSHYLVMVETRRGGWFLCAQTELSRFWSRDLLPAPQLGISYYPVRPGVPQPEGQHSLRRSPANHLLSHRDCRSLAWELYDLQRRNVNCRDSWPPVQPGSHQHLIPLTWGSSWSHLVRSGGGAPPQRPRHRLASYIYHTGAVTM